MPNDDNGLPLTTLVPGFLVSLRTTVSGNVAYNKEIIEADHKLRDGTQKAKWATERLISLPEEHTKACQTRMKARQTISRLCAKSAFGYLCPESKEAELNEAVREARRIAEAFNRRSRLSTVSVNVIFGRIARDDVEAARAIKSEVRDLVKAMSEGVRTVDAKAVREAAAKLKGIGSMLAPEAAAAVKDVIDTGRAAAKKIVKAGEEAAQQIDRDAIRKLTSARAAFLDMDDNDTVIQHPTTTARAVDLDPDVPDNIEEVPAEEPPARFRASRKVAGARTGRLPAKSPATSQGPKKGFSKNKRVAT